MKMDERARKNEGVILQAIAMTKLEPIAKELNVDQSTIHRHKQNVPVFAKMLAVCGLKVVPDSYRCVSPEVIASYEVLLRRAINDTTRSLIWDD